MMKWMGCDSRIEYRIGYADGYARREMHNKLKVDGLYQDAYRLGNEDRTNDDAEAKYRDRDHG